jgi:hypothetical protein
MPLIDRIRGKYRRADVRKNDRAARRRTMLVEGREARALMTVLSPVTWSTLAFSPSESL